MNIVIATVKSWNIKNALEFKQVVSKQVNVHIIDNKEELNYQKLQELDPEYIFFTHWSWMIPKEIYEAFTCVVFHMTDLPFGRGGSPLQNLIANGIRDTKISALKVDGGLDAGPIYIKETLNLNGTAEEIFIRASNTIFREMIPKILDNKLLPVEQNGEAVVFKRRKIEDGEITDDFNLEKIYDYIRMLDGEGYPKAYINFGGLRLEFSRASLKNGKIIADVEIKEVDNNE
ncbi:MAG: methionyl-tRNA formyltransferase [Firmicutes bacterium HGW-Firmicutes-1]|jgi:methionyl-tRNA formyltransferase|nr:MAG: methionyl-tRNA formyltransferase [Firmicutes bacterium HGW-Firmicutes-1]